MTNAPFAPQGFPAQYPQAPQGFPQQAPSAPPAPMPQGFPPAPQYAPQGFPQQPGMGWAPPVQQPQYQGPPPAQGSLDAFNAQPAGGSGPGLSWKNLQPNTPEATYTGTVLADVTDRDVQQDQDPQTKQLKFYRDGRPMFHMAVGLQLDPPFNEQAYPGGQATLYVRGKLHDALVQGMTAAGVAGAPKAGDRIRVVLVERRPGRGTIPANVYAVTYQPGPGWGNVQAPAPQAPQQAPQAPAQQPAPPAQQPAPQAPQYAPQAPAQQPAPQAPAAQLVADAYQQANMAAQPPGAPQAPAMFGGQAMPAMSPEQAALLARLTGQG